MPSSNGTLERSPAATREGQAASDAAARSHGGRVLGARRGRRLAQELPSHASAADAQASATAEAEPAAVERSGFPATSAPLHAHLPLAVLATASVVLAPALIVGTTLRPAGLPAKLGCALLSALLSVGVARVEALAWQRRRGATDLLYGELMLWGLARRWWLERRLRRISASYAWAAAESAGRVELLEGLNRLLEARNAFTSRHCRRVARYSEQIAHAMHLPPAEVARVRSAALVHDVGKVYTPLAILHKPGPLTDAEFEIVKRHATDGAEMLGPVHDGQLAAIVRHHHERIDGSGYPDGLRGEEIPLGARIVAVADTFDAITSQRPYRTARTHREALDVIAAEAGSQLDEDAVEAFRAGYTGRRSLASAAILTAVLDRAGGLLLPFGFGLGGSAAQLLPAIGAAGVLALAPGSRAEKAPQHQSAPQARALYSALGATLGGPAASTLGEGGQLHTSTGGPRTPPARLHAPRVTKRGAAGNPSGPSLAGGGNAGSTPSAPRSSVTEAVAPVGAIEGKAPHLPVTPPSGGPPAEEPPVTTTVSTPPVTAPSVTVPVITTPPVETAAGRIPSVSTSSAETPGVHVPPVQAPSVKMP